MESFRKLIKGWFGKALLVVFLAPVALVGIEGYFGGSNNKDIATTVNGKTISNKDLDELAKSYQQQYLQYVQGDESLLNLSAIRHSALDVLIGRTLLLQQAKDLGINLSDEQFVQMIAQNPSFQQDGKFSNEIFGAYLRQQGMTKEIFIEKLREDYALKRLLTTISSYGITNKADVERFIQLETQQRELYLASIKLDEFKKGLNISNQEILEYYNKHKETFKRSASVDVDYLVVQPSMFNTTPIEISDAELHQAYQQYSETQKKEATKEVQHILITQSSRSSEDALKRANEVESLLKEGKSFAELAKTYSDDTSTKDKAGLLDQSYKVGTLNIPELDQAIANAPDGLIATPVKTQFGYHVVLVKTNEVKIKDFDSIKTELKEQLVKRKEATLYTDGVNALNEAIVANDNLDVATQELKTAKLQNAHGITIWTKDPYLSNVNVKSKIFSDDVKNGDRNVSSSIQLPSGETIWVKVKQYTPQGLDTLEQSTPAIKEKLINSKAAVLAKAKFAETLKAFETLPVKEALQKSALKFEKAGIFTHQNLKQDVARIAFTLPEPKEGMLSVGTSDLADEVVIVGVSKVIKSDVNQLPPQEVQQFTHLYQQSHSEQEMTDYIEYLKSVAKIK